MTRIVVEEIVWDEWNISHIRKHRIKEKEVTEAGSSLIYHKRTYKGRYLAVGRSGRRLIAFVIRKVGPKTYYVITARAASVKERRVVYEKEEK